MYNKKISIYNLVQKLYEKLGAIECNKNIISKHMWMDIRYIDKLKTGAN